MDEVFGDLPQGDMEIVYTSKWIKMASKYLSTAGENVHKKGEDVQLWLSLMEDT